MAIIDIWSQYCDVYQTEGIIVLKPYSSKNNG